MTFASPAHILPAYQLIPLKLPRSICYVLKLNAYMVFLDQGVQTIPFQAIDMIEFII